MLCVAPKNPRTNPLLRKAASVLMNPPPAPRPAPPGRQQEYKDGQEEKCVQGRMIEGEKKINNKLMMPTFVQRLKMKQ